MPRLATFDGISIYVYAKDHAPPHVHGYHGDDEVLLLIETGEVYVGSLPSNKLKKAKGWLETNRAEAQSKWNESEPMNKLPTIKVTNIRVLSKHRLRVEFSDGTTGVADFSDLIRSEPFNRLEKQVDFAAADVEFGVVEWRSGVGIATEALYAMVHHLELPRTLEDVHRNERAVSLRQLRNMTKTTQPELAEAMGIDQSSLSRFESGADPKLSTVVRYIEALGAQVEVVAVLGKKRIPISGLVATKTPPRKPKKAASAATAARATSRPRATQRQT